MINSRQLTICLGLMLSGCGSYPIKTTLMVGDDRDRFGCVASAGYQWCGTENACVRPWELAKTRGLSLEDHSVKQYCANQGQSNR
jgi:hypothetical protein